MCSESKISDNPSWFCDDRMGLTYLVKVFGVLKQGADFDVRFYILDLVEFNSVYFRGMQHFGNMLLCSVCEEQDPKTGNRILNLIYTN